MIKKIMGYTTDNLQDLVSWDSSTLRDSRSAKGIIGELVACMGPEAAWQIAVELG
jgi:arginine-tRNA-protein transferase